MEITLTIDQGPVHIEVTGADWEEIEQEVDSIESYLNNSSIFTTNRDSSNSTSDGNTQSDLDAGFWEDPDNESTTDKEKTTSDHYLTPIAETVGINAQKLEDIVYADSGQDEEPQVLADKSSLGDSRVERQRNATHFILLVWEEIYDEEEMRTSKLKDILSKSGISDKDLYNAWNHGQYKGQFTTEGRGGNTTIKLTGPGRREARRRIRSFAETGEIED